MVTVSSLLDSVTCLAAALGASTDTTAITRFELKIACDDLQDPDAVPDWLCDILDALATGAHLPPWQPLDTSGDLTDPLNFFRTMDTILPMEIIDVGDNYTAIARALGLEAIIALVTNGYCTRPISPENR